MTCRRAADRAPTVLDRAYAIAIRSKRADLEARGWIRTMSAPSMKNSTLAKRAGKLWPKLHEDFYVHDESLRYEQGSKLERWIPAWFDATRLVDVEVRVARKFWKRCLADPALAAATCALDALGTIGAMEAHVREHAKHVRGPVAHAA